MDPLAATSVVLPSGHVSVRSVSPRIQRLRGWARLGGGFVLGQTITQCLNLVVGFALLRWLTTEDYAQFSFAFGFQAMLGVFLDLGATGAITALVGARTNDAIVVGSYVAAAKDLRRRMAFVALPIGMMAFLLAGAKHGWPWHTQVLLLGSVIAAVFAQGNASIHSAPLLMHRRLGTWYGVGSIATAGRLAVLGLLQVLTGLSGWLTAWVNTISTGVMAVFFRRAAAGYELEPTSASNAQRREMLRYLSPLIPGVVFTALQSQVTVLLITLFGRTENIAEVAALGRLGQVFALLSAFNGVVLQPHMAVLSREKVFGRYALALVTATAVAFSVCLVGWAWPGLLLWLLGDNYAHLGHEMRLLLLASSLQYVAGVMWAVHAARKWIFWWGSVLYIALTLVVQGALVALGDLSTTAGAMDFAVWSAVVPLVVHGATAGFAFACRK